MKVRTRWLTVFAACALTIVASGCTFDSSLGDVTCAQDGAQDGERVCRNGYWVAADDATTDTADATDTPADSEPDAVDIGPDAPSCDDGEELCDLECVDIDTSPEHCGGCGLDCIAYGQNSVAECGDGRCIRYCDAGFRDGNDDWLIDNPGAGSDGCEATCTPSDNPTEVCNGLDDDCDGRIDNAENEWFRDADGDGYGANDSVVVQCDRPSSTYVEEGGDCNDSNDEINPGLVEECQGNDCSLCNGSDDNCNGEVDENCPCTGTETQPCFPFGSGSADVGICVAGEQTCSDGTFGACTGATGPDRESCDGVDNDCDGTIDNGFSDKGDACSVGTGACQNSGTFVCNASGDDVTCDASAGSPSTETCDGVDNDCDGNVDEDFSSKGDPCTVSTGVCQRSGTFVCDASGNDVTCDASPGSPSTETCDGVDNDCDGTIDNGFSNKGDACSVGTGACQNSGTFVCTANGSGTTCSASEGSSSTETCDGVDNDCDGDVDEDFSNKGDACSVGTGACQNSGTFVCTANGSGTTCSASEGSSSTEVCDGVDNDCDGDVDEDFPTKGDACTVGTGACENTGTFVCNAGGDVTCSATRGTPGTETCDGVDSDCDGTADENDDDATSYCKRTSGQSKDCFNDSGTYCCRTPSASSC